MIRAIPTEHNGYRFRSRLEARWAVFFDRAGIPFQYEYEGYENTDTRLRYLPDFYLPWQKIWIEVKPFEPSIKELDKADIAVRGSDLQTCLIVEGDPFYPVATKVQFLPWTSKFAPTTRWLLQLADCNLTQEYYFSLDEEGPTELRRGVLTWDDGDIETVNWIDEMAVLIPRILPHIPRKQLCLDTVDFLRDLLAGFPDDRRAATQRVYAMKQTLRDARECTPVEVERAMITARQWVFR